MNGAEQPTPPSEKGPTGNQQDTISASLAKYIHELGHYSFNEKPNDYIRINSVIEDLMEVLLNSRDPYDNGLIIDGDEITKLSHKQGIKLYNKKKRRLHTNWILAITTITTIATITYSILS